MKEGVKFLVFHNDMEKNLQNRNDKEQNGYSSNIKIKMIYVFWSLEF